jgi:two-component system, LytTR family, response regulator LytT
MRKIFIIEDDKDLADNIEEILKFHSFDVVGKENSAENCMNSIMDVNPDIVLMDIILEGEIDGIQLAEQIREKLEIPIIFITANCDQSHLQRISKIDNDSFILKPFSKNVLITTINLSFLKYLRIKSAKNILNIRDKGSLVPLDEDDIIMLKADGLYTKINTKNKEYMIRSILKDVVGQLSEKKFIRIHKSYLININYVKAFNSKEVTIGEFKVPLRRGYLKELENLIGNRLNE